MVALPTPSHNRRLLVLPAYDRVEQELIARSTSEWIDPRKIITFSALLDALAAEALRRPPPGSWWRNRRFATSPELCLLRRQLLDEARGIDSNDELAQALLGSHGFSGLLGSFFDECAEGLVEPDELRLFVDETGAPPRVRLLSTLFSRYRARLAQLGLLEASDRLRLAADWLQAAPGHLPSLFAGVEVIEIRDIFDWSSARLAVVTRLATLLHQRWGPPERVQVVIPYSHEGHRLFHHLEPRLREIEARHDVPLMVTFAEIDAPGSPPAQVASALFQDATQANLTADAVTVIAAADPDGERTALARQIRSLIGSGCWPDAIAVGLRHPDRDWRELARTLDVFGVPWHYRRSAILAETPLLRFVSDVLAAVSADLPVAAFERISSSVFMPPLGESLAAPCSGWVGLLTQAGVRDLVVGAQGGQNGYEVRLQALLRRLRPARAATVETSANAIDRTDDETPVDPTRAAESTVAALLQRVEALCALRTPRTVAAWSRALADFLGPGSPGSSVARSALLGHEAASPSGEARGTSPRVSFRGMVMAHPEQDSPERTDALVLEALALAQRSWTRLTDLLGELARASGAEHLTLTTSGFRALLVEAAQAISLNPVGARGGAVRLLPVRQLAGASNLEHVFVPGLNEGIFPAPTRPDPLFGDHHRWAFDRWRRTQPAGALKGRAFPLEESPADGERLPVRRSEEVIYFCLGLAAAQQRAWVSHALRDEAGRPWVASTFVDALLRLGVSHCGPSSSHAALEGPLSPPEVAAMALRQAHIGLVGARSSAWAELAARALGANDYASVEWRARVALARRQFFERDREELEPWREAPTSELPADLLPYLGFVTHADALTWLAESYRFDRERPASASQLARYGCCPAQFFFGSVLGLQPNVEPDEEMDSMTRGNLLHDALDRLCGKLAAQRITDLGAVVEPVGRATIMALLSEALDEAASRAEKRAHMGHPALWPATRRRLVDRIIRALDHSVRPRTKKENRFPLAIPPAPNREWGFGGRNEPALTLDLGTSVGTIALRGRIDRIDESDQSVTVTDYKYGSPRKDWQLNRTDYQLPIYAMAVAQARGRWRPDVPIDVRYYYFGRVCTESLSWQELRPLLAGLIPSTPFDPPPITSDAPPTPTLREALAATVNGIRQGRFAAATRTCTYCNFATLCRVTPRLRDSEESP